MLKIDEKYYINTNTKSYILLRDTGRKSVTNGVEKEVFKVVGYYATLKQSLNAYAEQALKEYISVCDVNLSAVVNKLDGLKEKLVCYDAPFEEKEKQQIQEMEGTEDSPLTDDLDNPIRELEYEKSSN